MKNLKEWTLERVDKGFELENLKSLLREQGEENSISEMEEIYNEAIKPSIKLGFFEKRRIRKQLKALKRTTELQREIMNKLSEKINKLSKEEQETLEGLKKQMITAIIGDKEKEVEGLITIFEVSDEEGKPITKESLQKESIEDVANLMEDLVNTLEKEI